MEYENTEGEILVVEKALRRLQSALPGVLRYRFQNTLDHFERSFAIFDIDKEMSSFRAITGEEEAATTLMECIHLRKYQYASALKRRDHRHKAAIMACVIAIRNSLQPMLKEFQLVFDFEKNRIDVKIPLSNFDVKGGENYAIQLVEPLDLVHSAPSTDKANLYESALRKLAEQSQFENIRKMVSEHANARNTLLYASDARIPKSKATSEGLENRKNRALMLLVLTVMIWQCDKKLPLVQNAILAFMQVTSKLPANNLS